MSTDAGTSDLRRKNTLTVAADDETIPINQTLAYRDDVDDDDDNENESQNHQISFYT